MKFWETEHNEDDLYLSCQSGSLFSCLFSKWKKQGLYQLKEGMCLVQTICTGLGRLMSSPAWCQYDVGPWKQHIVDPGHTLELLSQTSGIDTHSHSIRYGAFWTSHIIELLLLT